MARAKMQERMMYPNMYNQQQQKNVEYLQQQQQQMYKAGTSSAANNVAWAQKVNQTQWKCPNESQNSKAKAKKLVCPILSLLLVAGSYCMQCKKIPFLFQTKKLKIWMKNKLIFK